jgi:hypothetical protein
LVFRLGVLGDLGGFPLPARQPALLTALLDFRLGLTYLSTMDASEKLLQKEVV